jgi:hypothetical protein
MFEKIILVALLVNFLLMLPAYLNTVTKLKLPSKPFQCSYCLGWWISLIISIVLWNPEYIIVACTAPVVATAMERAFNALPISL